MKSKFYGTMTLSQIQNELSSLGRDNFPFQDLIDKIEIEKKIFVTNKLEAEATQCWVFQTILEIHLAYNQAYSLIRVGDYYQAWCKLERAEITLKGLKRHFNYSSDIYLLKFIEKAVKNLQAIYPYRIFSSIELIELEKKCNICEQVLTIRNPCGHRVGEIYGGEQCIRIVTKSKVVGIALVENPVNKYAVMFTKDPKTDEQVDQYDYSSIAYLFKLINSPYEYWNLEIRNKLIPHSQFRSFSRNDRCPCGSGIKYKKCCGLLDGVKVEHHEFLVRQPTADRILLNSIKN